METAMNYLPRFLVSLSFWKRLLIIVELETVSNFSCISDISFLTFEH